MFSKEISGKETRVRNPNYIFFSLINRWLMTKLFFVLIVCFFGSNFIESVEELTFRIWIHIKPSFYDYFSFFYLVNNFASFIF